jgi:hypothetical protein
MNFINRALLRFTLLPGSLYEKMGVDLFQLECIVATKLTIDDRRPSAFRQMKRGKNSEKPVSGASLGTMLLSALMGCFYLVAFYFGTNIVSQLTLYFSFFIFILASTLIADFTAVLIDVRDNYIILPKPVNDRTVLVARLVHIFIHLCRIVIPMMIPALIRICMHYGGPGGIAFVIIVLMATLFTIFLINALYLVILKITTPQKFQSVISYFQIALAIAMYGGYQIAPRLLGRYTGMYIDFSSNPLMLLAPPYWFAAGWKVLSQFSGVATEYIGAVLCLLLPAGCIYIVVRFLAPAFNQKLSLITTSGDGPSPVAAGTVTRKSMHTASAYVRGLANWFTRKGAEQMGFLFAWKMTSRSRDFKMKVYPSIGYLVVWIVIMWMNNKSLTVDQLKAQEGSSKYMIIGAIYMCSFLLMIALNQLPYSEKYKAAWIYFIAPVQKPGVVISGGVKAVMLKFFIPVMTMVSVSALLIVGPAIIPNLLLGLFNQLLIASLIVYIGFKDLPFSLFQNTQNRSGAFIRGLFTFGLMFALGFAHYLVYNITPVVYILAVLSIAATWYLLDSIKNIEWNKIKSVYNAD